MSDTKPAGGTGTAHDATVVVENNVIALEEALAAARAAEKNAKGPRLIENLEAKADRLRSHLADTEAAIKEARAAQKGNG